MTDRLIVIEPGSVRDRCDRCGGWISMGHARGSTCPHPDEDASPQGSSCPCGQHGDEFCKSIGCPRL